MAMNKLKNKLKEHGYKILKEEPETDLTDACLYLENGIHITHGYDGGYMVVKELKDGKFLCYAPTNNLKTVLDNIQKPITP
jgi:hypothetical protein